MPKKRRIYPERLELIEKSRDAALSSVLIYNNPKTTFKKPFESYLEETLINKECSCSESFFAKSIIREK